MILLDLHVHPTPRERGPGAFRAYAEAAMQRGISILGFAEHGPACHSDPRYRGLEENEMEDYVREVLAAKGEFAGQIQIFCGLELDYIPKKLRYYEKLKERYPFDYFLVSVHLIDDWHVDDPASIKISKHRHKDLPSLYWLYYQQVIAAAKTGLFQGLAHIDYLRRSLPHPPGKPPDFTRDLFAEVAEEIAKCGVAVEVNTRGREIEASSEVHPTMPFLKQLVTAGAKFTLGSDAHDVSRVGDGLKEMRGMLRDEGVGRLVYFRGFETREIEA